MKEKSQGKKLAEVPLLRLKVGDLVLYPKIEKQPDGSLKILNEDMLKSIAEQSTKNS